MSRIDSLKELLNRNKVLLQNFGHLSVLQFLNILMPLIAYPYLIRVLGKETYGLVIFAQAIIAYFVILVGFGFNFSATKEVSIHRDNKNKLSEIVSSVLIIKSLLFFTSFALLLFVVLLIPEAKDNKYLFYFTMWMCLNDLLFPTWYFQGIERMKYITYISLLSRSTFLILIFLFIKSPDHFLYVPVLNGCGAILAGLSALYIVFKRHKIEFRLQSFNVLKAYFADSIPIFFSNISTTIYLTTNKVVLGSFVGMTEVAYYDLAEKLSTIIKAPIQLLGQALFPKVSKERNLAFLKNSFYYSIAFSTIVLIFSILLGNFAIKTLGGEGMEMAVTIFYVLVFSLIPVTTSLFFGNIALLAWGYNKLYLKLRVYSNLAYFILLGGLFIIQQINIISLSYIALGLEVFVAILAFSYSKRKGLNFLNLKAVRI